MHDAGSQALPRFTLQPGPEPEIPKSEYETQDPKPETRNPKPEFQTPNIGRFMYAVLISKCSVQRHIIKRQFAQIFARESNDILPDTRNPVQKDPKAFEIFIKGSGAPIPNDITLGAVV
jgi:hypothetical protein